MHERAAATASGQGIRVKGNQSNIRRKSVSGKSAALRPPSGAGVRSAEGTEQSGDPPPPLSRSGIDVVGKRQLGPLYVGLLSFLVPVPSLYVPVPSLYVPVPSLPKNRAGHGNVRQRSIVGYGICVRASTVDAGFPRKAQRPRLPPLLSRSGVDVKDSPIRASTRGSFVLPCNLCRHSMYLCRHSVVVGDRRGPRRHLLLPTSPEWSGRPIFAGLAASLRCQVGSRALPLRRRSACHKT